MAVERLRTYWLPQYITRKELKKGRTFKQWKMIVELCQEVEYTSDVTISKILKALTRTHGVTDKDTSKRLNIIPEESGKTAVSCDNKCS